MLRPKKSLGQNFLVDQKVVRDLVNAAEITRSDLVLEVGAGTGTVTRELAKRVGKVIAVEFDRDLIPTLKLNLEGLENVKIINADILKLDLSELINDKCPPASSRARPPSSSSSCQRQVGQEASRAGKVGNYKIIGSIPFQITSPLIHKLPETREWSIAILLIQREVAEKITARSPKATYLSNFIAAFAEVEIVKNVPKTAFRPRPNVDGSIIKIRKRSRPYTLDPKSFGDFLHYGFSHPRKMLKNVFPERRLEEAEINPQARAQELTLEDWLALYKGDKPQSTP